MSPASVRLSDYDIVRARDIPIATLVGRDVLLRNDFGLCPLHNEKSPSLHILRAKNRFHCFGCGARGGPIDWIMRTRDVPFAVAVRELLGGKLDPVSPAAKLSPSPKSQEDNRNVEFGQQIWQSTEPVTARNAAGQYLISRALPITGLSGDIRAHPSLNTGEGESLPALVAAVRNSRGIITAIQRTWVLRRQEVSADSPVQDMGARHLLTRKKSLGPLLDGCIRLGMPNAGNPVLGLSEGLESGLSAQEIRLTPTWVTCGISRWGNAQNPPQIWLPPEITRLVLFADNDAAGRQSAEWAASWWSRAGLDCVIEYPDPAYKDWNEQLVASRSI